MHNAERTEARLNYSTVSGLPAPPLLDAPFHVQIPDCAILLPVVHFCLPHSSQVRGSAPRYFR